MLSLESAEINSRFGQKMTVVIVSALVSSGLHGCFLRHLPRQLTLSQRAGGFSDVS